MEHKGEKLTLRITGQPKDTTLNNEDTFVVSDDGIPENQVERKAASKAYLTPRSDIPEDWQSITNELDSRRRQEALQMKTIYINRLLLVLHCSRFPSAVED